MNTLQNSQIILYTKMNCPWCEEVKGYLRSKNIPFEEREVTGNFDFFTEMKEISGQTKAPVLVWGEDVLADTDVEAVAKFLKSKKIIQ
jgi:glutaredoxin